MPPYRRTSGIPLPYRGCALLLSIVTACCPALAAAAAPTIPGFYGKVPMPGAPLAGTLPELLNPYQTPKGLSDVPVQSGNTLTVNQNAAQATIDWSTFNIAPGAVVIFNQKSQSTDTTTGQTVWTPQPSWTALNRIYDTSPSLIFGNLKADGKVYLINRNGILFGPGSQVDVHSLAASALNISDDNFKNGKLRFTTASYGPNQGPLDPDAFVSNYGTITTDNGGSVYLVGPNVVNAGTISSPSGKINLVAVNDGAPSGTGEVAITEITEDATGTDVAYNDTGAAGAAYNAVSGRLITEGGGRVGMYGATVQTDGLIRSVTALKKQGVIFLSARDKVTTGERSTIESPIDSSTETAGSSFNYTPGYVGVTGLNSNLAVDSTGKFTSTVTALARIEHLGSINAPAGSVKLNAAERIYLGENSSIDVAGLWLDRPASANLLEAQLNSVELRDDYGQKYGALLGQKIHIDLLTGSTIGNLSKNYQGVEHSAQERSTVGGNIFLGLPDILNKVNTAALNEIIVKDGAQLDFSGGGTRYATGTMATSRVISGNTLYDLGSAPQWIRYDRLADSQTRSYKRFGLSEEFKGLFLGGGSSLQDLTAGRVAGSDAGSVTFNARVAVLDGTLLGSVIRGLNQASVTERYTAATPSKTGTPDNPDFKVSVARGLEEPLGGSVTVGQILAAEMTAENVSQDFSTWAISVKEQATPLAQHFGPDDDLNREVTEISSTLLNRAGLSALRLFADTGITTEKGAGLSLLPGGSYIARARRIEFAGAIDAPGGAVEMTTRPNISSPELLNGSSNPLYQSLTETIYLGGGSRISVAGRQIDNSAVGMADHPASAGAHTAGGSITIRELNEDGSYTHVGTTREGHSVVVADGALLDVSGGWLVDAKGKISGGNAGSLELKGPTISLAGELRGFSLPGRNGGELKLHAGEVLVTSHDELLPANMAVDGTVPDYLLGKLVLGQNRLTDTGFTRVSMTAIDDLTIMGGAHLSPSTTKSQTPVPALAGQSGGIGNLLLPVGNDQTAGDYQGVTSLTLNAGSNIVSLFGGNSATSDQAARITVSSGTELNASPGGTISLSAPAINIAGRIEVPGGTISANAAGISYALTVEQGGQLMANGYSKPSSGTVPGLPAGPTPQPGGTIRLTATGNVVLEAGSRVEVSGSAPVERLLASSDGLPVLVTSAADPGTLTLTYGAELSLDGEIAGRPGMDNMRGGNLSVTNSISTLLLREEDIARYQRSGFDALTFTSNLGAIKFPVALDVSIGRSLTLNSAMLDGETGGDVRIKAPWISLLNTSSIKAGAPGTADDGIGRLSLLGGYIDVQGSVQLNGFRDVSLEADHDLRLTDRLYDATKTFEGALGTTGNLTLQAARIYPTTASNFTVTSRGVLTTLPGQTVDPAPLYSAGGSLTLTADGGIEHRGLLAAPQGTITLVGGTAANRQESRVYLAEGSSITTAGAVPVAYGSYDGSTWTVKDGAGPLAAKGPKIIAAPARSITLSGSEVIVEKGSIQDVSGGGSIYTTLFQAGIPGSLNPLTSNPKRYVILADNSVRLPGPALYLESLPSLGLTAGTYSILPADFAFLPGALVVEDTGLQLLSGQKVLSTQGNPVSTQGYPVVAGYATVADTSISSTAFKGYSVRKAVDVLREGDFTVKRFSGGDGGSFTLDAKNGASFAGTLREKSLAGYQGGTLSFIAKNVTIRDQADPLPVNFDFITPLPGDPGTGSMSDTLQLDLATVSKRESNLLRLGDAARTSTVRVQEGVTLEAPSVTLSARESVTLDAGVQVLATGANGPGIASVVVPRGNFTLAENALLRGSNGLRLDVRSADLRGELVADNGSLSLAADRIIFTGDQDKQTPGTALYLTESRWSGFAASTDLTLISRTDMQFLRDVNLVTAGALTLDTPRIDGPATVALTTNGRLTLLNSSPSYTLAATAGAASLSFSADEIVVVPRSITAGTPAIAFGNIVFDGYRSVSLNSRNDLLLKGAGTIRTAGDLTLSAARLTTSYYSYAVDPNKADDFAIPFTAADITIDAFKGAVTLADSIDNGTPLKALATATPGGRLRIQGDSITQSGGTLEVPSGQVTLVATNNINLAGSILARGSRQSATATSAVSYFPGGQISLKSSAGTVALADTSRLDVSAADQGDAGSVTLSAPLGAVTAKGNINGAFARNSAGAQIGKGGSLTIDSLSLDGLGGLDGVSTLASTGGFNERLTIRSRSKDLVLGENSTLTAHEVIIAADNASIDIQGKIVADGLKPGDAGGRVELYAANKLVLESSAVISARGMNGAGGADGTAGADGVDSGNGANGAAGVNGGDGGTGGTVALSSLATAKLSGAYALLVSHGAKIDVTSGAGAAGGTGGAGGIGAPGAVDGNKGADGAAGSAGAGGLVAFRAYQLGTNDANMAELPADAITGAARVAVEEAKVYTAPVSGNIGALSGYSAFMTNANLAVLKTRLFKNVAIADTSNYHLLAGIEVVSANSNPLTFNTAWDLKTIRPGSEPGVVTLRAKGNLVINQNLSDAPTALAVLRSDTMKNTWGINLVAGSDSGANYRDTASATGNLSIASGRVVYTENAPVSFVAAGDATLSGWSTATGPGFMINTDMKYNLGSYGGSVRGRAGNNLNLNQNNSAIQTALGSIDISTGGNLDLGSRVSQGAIRTTGEYYDPANPAAVVETMTGTGAFKAANISDYWIYRNGGSISLNVGASLTGNLDPANGWDGAYIDASVTSVQTKALYPWYLAAGYGGSRENGTSANVPVTAGVATMGGGNITILTGGSLLTQVGAFGNPAGNLKKDALTLFSGGDMIGRFRVMNGRATLTSGGLFGRDDAARPTYRTVVELGAAQVNVAALGDVTLGAQLNPDNSRDRLFPQSAVKKWNMTYSRDAGIAISSLAGNATLYGTDNFTAYSALTSSSNIFLTNRQRILPAFFSLAAAGDLQINNSFALAPSSTGNLSLLAGGNISGAYISEGGSFTGGFTMADVTIDSYYGRQVDSGSVLSGRLTAVGGGTQVNHLGDSQPVMVTAGTDIDTVRLVLNKPALVSAGGDIRLLDLIGQNTAVDSLTSVTAGGSVDQGVTPSWIAVKPEIVIGGPGTLLVQAGQGINMGNSRGVQSIGNLNNKGFTGDSTDSDIIIVVGAKQGIVPVDNALPRTSLVAAFFETLKNAGNDYSTLKAAGKTDEANLRLAAARAEIVKYFDGPAADGSGALTMLDSEISAGKGKIYILTRGDLNVGRTAISEKSPTNTGISTTFGGGISVYNGGDTNVNESRVMSFMGGDILIWSDQGSINAGRGSKTTVSSAGTDYKYDVYGNLVSIIFRAPAVGSGLRALTYDPDGSSGPLTTPEPGNIYGFAPNGIIDAGEAGIAGGKVVLGATQVLNANNISFSAGSVGVPTSSGNSVSLGSLSGTSNVTDSSKMIETASSGGLSKESAQNRMSQAADDFLSKYLDVKVISFDAEMPLDDKDSNDEQDRKKKKK